MGPRKTELIWNELCQIHIKLVRAIWGPPESICNKIFKSAGGVGPQIARINLKRKLTYSYKIEPYHLGPARTNLKRYLRNSYQIGTDGAQKVRTNLARTLSNSYQIDSAYLGHPELVWNEICNQMRERPQIAQANFETTTEIFVANWFVSFGACSTQFGTRFVKLAPNRYGRSSESPNQFATNSVQFIKLVRSFWDPPEPVWNEICEKVKEGGTPKSVIQF